MAKGITHLIAYCCILLLKISLTYVYLKLILSYLNVVQTTCPHILRYITAAAIISKRRKNIMKELVKIIQQESYNYRDPITELVECLYVNFDFDGAQVKLRECDQVSPLKPIAYCVSEKK